MNITERLDAFLKERNLTIHKLTEMTDLSDNTIYLWYKGNSPSVETLEKVCNALQINLGEFFATDEEIKSPEHEIFSAFKNLTVAQKNLITELINEFVEMNKRNKL